MQEKHKQLGMNPSTASGRLLKDLLFKYAVASGEKCFRCNEELTRETFSIEHKIPWLHSENPVELFFDLDNIAFSHLLCNIGNRRPSKYESPTKGKRSHGINGYRQGCRCQLCNSIYSNYRKDKYSRLGT